MLKSVALASLYVLSLMGLGKLVSVIDNPFVMLYTQIAVTFIAFNWMADYRYSVFVVEFLNVLINTVVFTVVYWGIALLMFGIHVLLFYMGMDKESSVWIATWIVYLILWAILYKNLT